MSIGGPHQVLPPHGYRPRDEQDPPVAGGRNPEVDFRGQRRRRETHASGDSCPVDDCRTAVPRSEGDGDGRWRRSLGRGFSVPTAARAGALRLIRAAKSR